MKNTVREKLLAGQTPVGTFFETGSATVAECLGLAGLDYLIIDTEHGPFDPLSALDFVRAARLYVTVPFARAPELSRSAILKLLDIGAMGIVVPNVRTVAEAEAIVEYGKYPPLGHRGVANTAGSGFWFEDDSAHGLAHYFEVSNRETLLLPQCETAECLRDLEQIVRIPGIDGIFVGPFDLSAALGCPGQFDAPAMRDALARIPAICRAAGKFSFLYAADAEAARAGLALGYDSVAVGMDATVLTNAFSALRRSVLEAPSI